MRDTIYRDEAINSIYKLKKTVIKHDVLNYRDGLFDALEIVQDLPSANRPQGEWLETEERETYIDADWDADPIVPVKYRLPMCSICGKEFGTGAFDYNFCPNCGARMKGANNGK